MIKVHDCSNSNEYHHTGRGGPVVNDVMRQLRSRFRFVDDPNEADVVITNDIFPSYIPEEIPKVKRMDGSFWMQQNVCRNEALDRAASQANAIVYVSEYSKKCHLRRKKTPENQKHFVALNKANPIEFPRRDCRRDYTGKWISVASDWSRPEKRWKEVKIFSGLVKELIVVGKLPDWEEEIPNNIMSVGYIKDYKQLSDLLGDCDGMFNPSYRDAAPKTVAQAISVGIPVLYADSGGTGEIVSDTGFPILDIEASDSLGVTSLNLNEIKASLEGMREKWSDLRGRGHFRRTDIEYETMLNVYEEAIKGVVNV